MSLVSQVKQKVSDECFDTKCNKEGCLLTLVNVPRPFLLIDMDHEKAPIDKQDQNRCDYIFVSDDGAWTAPLELTRGKLEASKVVPQLKAGAKVVERIVPPRARVQFRAIAIYGGEFRRAERDKLNQKTNHIPFRGEVYPIKARRCGSPLVSVLGKA